MGGCCCGGGAGSSRRMRKEDLQWLASHTHYSDKEINQLYRGE